MGKAWVSGETFKSAVPYWQRGNKLLCQTVETQLCLLKWGVVEMPPTLSQYPSFVRFLCQLRHIFRSAVPATINRHLDANMRAVNVKKAQYFDS